MRSVDGHDGPVDRARDAGEAVLRTFDQVHDGAEDQHHDHDASDKDRDLRAARAQRIRQHAHLAEQVPELQHTKDAQQTDGANDEQDLRAAREQRRVRGKDREQVDHAEEAPRVADRSLYDPQPQQVLEREDDRQPPLASQQDRAVALVVLAHAVEHHHRDAVCRCARPLRARRQQRRAEARGALCVRGQRGEARLCVY
jgi:hypothetical protein